MIKNILPYKSENPKSLKNNPNSLIAFQLMCYIWRGSTEDVLQAVLFTVS